MVFQCKYRLMSKIDLFQAIHVCKTDLIQTIQFSLSMQFSRVGQFWNYKKNNAVKVAK